MKPLNRRTKIPDKSDQDDPVHRASWKQLGLCNVSVDLDDSEDPLFPISSSTPSSSMKDSGFGMELLSPSGPDSLSAISPGRDMVFDYSVEPPSRTQPIAISQRKKAPSQRHTNFTPPREYMSPISVRRASMTNFCVCGSLPRPLSLFMTDGDDDEMSFTESPRERYVSKESRRYTFSEPGFSRRREQQIGRELRTISDFFQMETGGYEYGYQFEDHQMPSRFHHRQYSSSFPGASDRNACHWQYSIKHYPLQCQNQCQNQPSDK